MKMKATKKIVGAACALVAATALAAGSTFAWFASNGEVTATGLSVNVKTDNAYLVIASEVGDLKNGAKQIDLDYTGEWNTTADADNKNALLLLPSAYKVKNTSTEETDPPFVDTGIVYQDKKETEKAITNPGTWYTGKGTSATDGTLDGTPTALTQGDWSNYVVESKIFVSVLGTVPVKTVKMSMTKTFIDTAKTNDALTVLVMYRVVDFTSTGVTEPTPAADWEHFEVTCAASSTLQNKELLKTGQQISETSCIEMKVLVYFDGNSSVVTTSNQAKLTGATFDFSFNSEGNAEVTG